MNHANLEHFFSQLQLPRKNSHKGQNGKLLLIGGSELFHAASKWSLDVASKIVDMVFYSSVTENNELVKKAKGEFWNGIVIERDHLDAYIEEADCVLIGPGMERNEETASLVNTVLKKYPTKKFVIDAGALQMVDPNLFSRNHIITPHTKEMSNLQDKVTNLGIDLDQKQLTILQKGVADKVTWSETNQNGENQKKSVEIRGGNEGMTKGGTGDVLAGLVAALYCNNQANISAIVASAVNKQAGDELYKTVGPFFNATDLVETVPRVLWKSVGK